jgi:tRNA U55 pseudouridine synthase TruB
MGIYRIKKQEGEVMNQVLARAKSILHNNGIIPTSICYAGRLDPLASGSQIILTDKDTELKMTFCYFDKQYTFSVLKGFGTDTFDIMGIPSQKPHISELKFNVPHTLLMKYPEYSNFKINGKPYWWYAKNKQKPPLVPFKNITIYQFNKTGASEITGDNLLKLIKNKINKVSQGDFRQTEIITKWTEIIIPTNDYQICHYSVTLSSGGYVRSLGDMLGGCCFNIVRQNYGTEK